MVYDRPETLPDALAILAGGPRTILAGGTGYGSSGPPRAHFGLREATKADQVEVRWPDGRIVLLTDVPGRGRVSTEQGSWLPEKVGSADPDTRLRTLFCQHRAEVLVAAPLPPRAGHGLGGHVEQVVAERAGHVRHQRDGVL